jgi:hypothetical protein
VGLGLVSWISGLGLLGEEGGFSLTMYSNWSTNRKIRYSGSKHYEPKRRSYTSQN